MKKNILLLLSLMCAALSFSQVSFEKNKIVVGVNYDIGIYNTEGWVNEYPDITRDTDKAASTIPSVWGEYGVMNWLGVGLRAGFSNYFTETDSVYGNKPTVKSTDIGLQVSVHAVRTKKFDLPLVLVFGSSIYNHKENDAANSSAKDVGTFSNIAINPRFYFGSSARFGMNIKIGWATYAYKSVEFKSGSTTFDNYYTLKGSGGNFLIGFQYNIK